MRFRMLAVLAVLLIGGTAKTSSAFQEIEGGFGFKLGDKFDTSLSSDKTDLDDGSIYYFVNPPKPYPPLDTYRVHVVPDTGKIIGIIGATRTFEMKCYEERETLIDILTPKYGKGKLYIDNNLYINEYVITKNSKSISISCEPYAFELSYYDKKAQKEYENTARKKKAKQKDSSGL